MDLQEALNRLAALAGPFEPGSVCLVGAGPGDSALISVRGAVRLAQADVVLHDRLIGPELLAVAASRPECVFVGKWRGEHPWTQERINAALVEHARAGKRVVRLKGGDPFVFGRGGEECEHLAVAGIRYEVVPGITAAFGAPAAAGIPLTHRGISRSFALVTAHAGPGDDAGLDYAALARMETVAVYMGIKHLEHTCARLVAAGLPTGTPVAIVQWGTTSRQRTLTGTLSDIAAKVHAEHITPPALVLIGQVVRLRETIAWFERRPLYGVSALVTRMRGQAAGLSDALIAAGAEVIEAPTIAIAPPEDLETLDAALARLPQYDWLVLTSANGVDALFGRLAEATRDARALAGVRVAAIGSATQARLQVHGIQADLMPEEAVGEAVAEALIHTGVKGRRVLLMRGDLARAELPRSLRASGAACDEVIAYRTVCPPSLPRSVLQRLDDGEIDWITLTSPSCFENLLRLAGEHRHERLRRIRLASIGPVTTAAVHRAGFEPAAEADPHDVPGLVAAIRRVVEDDRRAHEQVP